MEKNFRLAVCQMKVADDKRANIERATDRLRTAAENRANIAVLPEMFNCPYDNSKFKEYCETAIDGETIKAMAETAKETGMYIVAGTIPELDEGNIYNTSFIFDKNGNIIGRHRKMHLFDINIQGRISFKESDTLSAGNDITVVDTEYGRIGVAICYDIRFPELFRLMSLKGAGLIIVPAAFNMVTGPVHWEPLIKIRAIDNQVYMVAASPARDTDSVYVAYGNSMIVEPWGGIVQRAGAGDEIICGDIDLSRVDRVRRELPLLQHRRTDIYEVSSRQNLEK